MKNSISERRYPKISASIEAVKANANAQKYLAIRASQAKYHG